VEASTSGWKPSLLVHCHAPTPSPSTQVHVVHEVCDEQIVDLQPTQ
jgi:hypothetical protein